MASLITINGQNPTRYGARLVSYNTGAPVITNTYQSTNVSLFPYLLGHQVGLRGVTVTLEFSADDRKTATQNLSEVTSLVQSKCELLLPDGFYYFCTLTGISEPEENLETLFDVTFSFDGVRHGEWQTVSLSDTGGTLTCKGNLPAECTIDFLPTSSTATVMGITFYDLSIGEEVFLNSMDKTVSQLGENIWANSDLVNFPRLNPGDNHISAREVTSLTIGYYPIWL